MILTREYKKIIAEYFTVLKSVPCTLLFCLSHCRESNPSFDVEIRDDVIEECNKHGGVLHIYVDKTSAQGNVYVKCPSIASAVASVTALHGRWFAGESYAC